MAWALLVIAVGFTVAMLVIVLGYRRAIIVISVIILVSVIVLIWYAESDDSQKSDLVPVEMVQLINAQMIPVYGGSYKLTARVKNNTTKHALTVFGLSVIASDCIGVDDSSQCVVIGEKSKEIHILVPPSQARDITDQFIFDNMRPKGELRWDYRVDYTRAK